MTDVNPFDALDAKATPDELAALDVFRKKNNPGFFATFATGRKTGYYQDTLLGHSLANNEQQGAAANAAQADSNLPQWEDMNVLQKGAYVGGRLVGNVMSPENFVGAGLGVKALDYAGVKTAGWGAKLFAGALDAAVINVPTDTGLQVMDIYKGKRDKFSMTELAASTALGMVVGGAGTLGHHAFSSMLGDAPVPKVYQDAKLAPPEPIKPNIVADAVKPETPVPSVNAGQEGAVSTPSTVTQQSAVQIPDNATAQPSPDLTPALGDVLDARAREVRGLPPRVIDQPVQFSAIGPRPADAAGALAWDIHYAAMQPEGQKAILQNIETWKQAQPTDPHYASSQENLKTVEQISPELLTPKAPEYLASFSQGPRPGQLQRDAAGVPLPLNAPAEAPQLVRLQTTMENLSNALDATAIRQGRIPAQAKADGIYKTQSGVIRLKKPQDFDVLAHELGHHLEVNIGKPLQDLMQRHAAELQPMAYAGAKAGTELKEGFAEYMRLHVTNPSYAANAAPKFDAALRQFMAKDHTGVASALNDAATAWRSWLDQPSAAAVASTIVSSQQPKWFPELRKQLSKYGLGDTISERISSFYAGSMDALNPLNKAVRGLAAIYKKNNPKSLLDLNAADDPYKLARLLPGAYQAGHMDLMHGVVPFRQSKPATSSLRDALVMAMGHANVLSKWNEDKLREFGSYLWSRRALGEWERFDQGLIPNTPDKLTRGDHIQNIADMEAANPRFAEAAPMVHDFATGLWTKKYEAGLITHKQWQDGLMIKDYVPGLRAFDHEGDAVGAGGRSGAGASGKGSMVKQFKGSNRDVLNPIESLIQDAYQTSRAIAQNEMVKALDRLAIRAGVGGGAIAERIPSHEMKATTVGMIEALDATARAEGLNAYDTLDMRMQLEDMFGEKASGAIYRPAIINEKGEAIAFFRDGGELKALRLADGEFGQQLHGAMTMMNGRENNVFVDMLAIPGTVLRAGITSSPDFLIANFVRDQTVAAIFYGKPIKRIVGAVSGMADELYGRDAARMYNMAGGIMGGAEVSGLRDARVNSDINALRKKGWGAERMSLHGFFETFGISETGMRIGLFKDFFDEAKGRGLSDHEAMLEAAYQARDHIDFNRRGSQMMAISRIVPFLNASLQGVDKAWRQMVQPIFREGLTVAEQTAKGQAYKAWARISALTVATMGLHAIMSENDEYKDFSPQTKATHWVIKTGDTWVVIPKPFELGAVLNAGSAAYDAMVRHDPRWAEEYLQGLYEVVMPPNVLKGNPAIATSFEFMTGVDLRSGQAIVPDHLAGLKPWLQYDQRTSEMFKSFGKATNTSPMFVQNMFEQHSGSIGRAIISLYDMALSDKPTQGWDDAAFTRRFIKDASRGASSTRAFWDMVGTRNGKLEGARKSWEAMNQAGDPASAADFLASQDTPTKAWIAAGTAKPDIRRLHPYMRARSAVSAINDLRRDLVQSTIDTATGTINIPAQQRGAADDILSKLAMTEARNALVMMKVPGWSDRQVMETAGYYRELQSLSPPMAKALADRFATAKVLPLDIVEKLWPEAQRRLLQDGSKMRQDDLVARAKSAGFEMDGKAIKRKPRVAVPGLN